MISIQVQSRKEIGLFHFPFGIPRLWCPPLTHYKPDGSLDKNRIASHLKHLSPYVKTHLVFGSTGDGWELSDAEMSELLDFLILQADELDLRLLIGVLRPDADVARRRIIEIVGYLKQKCDTSDPEKALSQSKICGFTIALPREGSCPNLLFAKNCSKSSIWDIPPPCTNCPRSRRTKSMLRPLPTSPMDSPIFTYSKTPAERTKSFVPRWIGEGSSWFGVWRESTIDGILHTLKACTMASS